MNEVISIVNDKHRVNKSGFSAAVIFRAKATLLQIDRVVYNVLRNETARFPVQDTPCNEPIAGQSRTRLWTAESEAEKSLSAGKVHNLRLALRRLNGVEVPAGSIFSFWTQIGRASRWRGYVPGRELREGCIIPTTGGGLCQLSNALYETALSAGFDIIERHAHTQVVPGSLAAIGRDATVFWNYVDLRFKSSWPFRIEAMMDADFLTVRFRSMQSRGPVKYPLNKIVIAAPSTSLQSCVTCDVPKCFRHVKLRPTDFGCAAYLVDEYYSEFDNYILKTRGKRDLLVIPLDGKKFGKGNYAWTTHGFRDVRQSRIVTILRAYQSRKFAAQGAARQRAQLAYSERLVKSYSSLLKHDVTHVTVSQNLLPFLWRGGYLGGRSYDVLMTALPLAHLHERLDAAFALHPESKTLGDFRANEWLVRTESEALRYARRIITPHSEIAALYQDKVILLNWTMPSKRTKTTKASERFAAHDARIAFPASTVGRKGAYELRAAVQGLNVQVVTLGAQLEGKDFWRGASVEHREVGNDWLEDVDLVVLPAFVEHQPRKLLEALACGTPVIATTACGLKNIKEVTNIPAGDVAALREEIKKAVPVRANVK